MRRLYVMTFSAVILLLGGEAPQPGSGGGLNKKLNELSRIGVSHRFLDENTIELRDTLAGWTRVKTLKEPDEAAIRNWASTRGIPVIDIDPTLVDTSKWTGWYNYWTNVPVANDLRIPTQVRDFDGNGFPEVYGNFGGVGFPQTRCYEVHPDGSSALRRIYPSTTGYSTHIVDIDRNGLMEVAFSFGQLTYVYEQAMPLSLPTQLKFAFNPYDGLARYVSIEHMVDMDGDSVLDFVHRGADTTISQYYLIYVSEYNHSITNFQKKWFVETPTTDFFDGFDVGDYDEDGNMEFLASSLWGKLFVVENGGDNTYAVTFQDSLPLVNMYYQSSGDVDRDGSREFFIGATMGSGNWTTMYEANGDNLYTPRIVLHLLSGGSLDDPPYFTEDVDGDGVVELVILSGGYLYIFKSDANDSYYLWYLRKGLSGFSMNVHDMNGDGIKDILVTSIRNSSWVSDIYTGSPLVSVGPEPPSLPDRPELQQNYPNPFNPSTVISYEIPVDVHVTLKVYDVLGREVTTLVNGVVEAGYHQTILNANNLASGLYFYRLQAGAYTSVKKLMLMK